MPTEVIMPKVDMDMTAGTFALWHVEEGQPVAKGEPLFDIETDKSAMEVEAPATGTLRHVLARPGERIAVGAPVAWIYAKGEAEGERPGLAPVAEDALPAPAARPAPSAEPAFDPGAERRAAAQPAYGSSAASAPIAATAPAAIPVAAPTPPTPGPTPEPIPGRPRATPAARRLARENGIVLDGMAGSGPLGRVQGDDVTEALRARAEPEPPGVSPATPAPVPAVARGVPDAEAPAPAWTAEGGELHVSRRKGEGTPLLLVHGFAADSMGWAPFERELPSDLPLLRIDLPSHGRSPRMRVDGFQTLLRQVLRAFDAAVEGPVHLLGHSLGGAVALGLADVRPRQVASLTLLAPAGLGPEIDAATLGGIARASRVESLAPWLGRLTATPEGLSWDFARAAMLARTDPAMRAAQGEMADALFPDATQSFDLRAALGRVAAPAAVIWGREDRVVPWRQALAAPGEMALHLMPGVGHIPHVERPVALAGIVARHLAAGSWVAGP